MIVKPDCFECLNHEGYGWMCDQNPGVFEPEHEYVDNMEGGRKNGVKSDFSKIPKDRKIYCREFIPSAWRDYTYQGGKWWQKEN